MIPIPTTDASLTLAHPVHGQHYHSSEGAVFEGRHLYLGVGQLRSCLDSCADSTPKAGANNGPSVTVLDVGLGLGYNAVLTWQEWLAHPSPRPLTVISLESDEHLVQALASGQAAWQSGWPEDWRQLAAMIGEGGSADLCHRRGAVGRWRIELGRAEDGAWTKALAGGRIQRIWQDAFSHEVNPELWSESWFRLLRQHAARDAVLATYSVARSVRDGLAAAGWKWEKTPTPGRKRHWLRAQPIYLP